MTAPRSTLSIRSLKEFADMVLRERSVLRRVLLVEPDSIPAEEFVGKLGTWLSILGEEMKE